MARTGVEVEGLRETVRDLLAMGVELDDLKDAFAKIASEAANRAAGHVESDSGRLAGSVRGNRAKGKAVVTVGRATVPYAGPINYGWAARNIKADNFLQEADDEMQPIAVERLETEIDHLIQQKGLR